MLIISLAVTQKECLKSWIIKVTHLIREQIFSQRGVWQKSRAVDVLHNPFFFQLQNIYNKKHIADLDIKSGPDLQHHHESPKYLWQSHCLW